MKNKKSIMRCMNCFGRKLLKFLLQGIASSRAFGFAGLVGVINFCRKSLAECTIYGISLSVDYNKNVSIVGGLTIGSSKNEVDELFGTEYGAGSSESISVYGTKPKYRFAFYYDDSMIIKDIMLDFKGE